MITFKYKVPESLIKDFQNYPFLDVILCGNTWMFYDWNTDSNYIVEFTKDGMLTVIREYYDSKEIYIETDWCYNKQDRYIKIGLENFEVVYIDENIIVFQLDDGNSYSYFHLINTQDTEVDYFVKDGIESYLEKNIEENNQTVSDTVCDMVDLPFFKALYDEITGKIKVDPLEIINDGSDELYRHIIQQGIEDVEKVLDDTQKKLEYNFNILCFEKQIKTRAYDEAYLRIKEVIHELRCFMDVCNSSYNTNEK